MGPLAPEFYERPVLEVAREMVGCMVVAGGAAGMIVEVEAYHDSEPACHAFVGLTPRTRVIFGPPGRAYVYRSYGIHALLNAVCEAPGVGAAVLIRALAPRSGQALMRERRGQPEGARGELALCSGPGRLTQALGVELEDNDTPLDGGGPVTIEGPAARGLELLAGPRVGITKAVELPWRFCLAGDPNVSRPRPSGWPRRGGA